MTEVDINMELLDDYGYKYYPSEKNLTFSQRYDLKKHLLETIEIIDRFEKYSVDIIFCCLLKDMFGFEKDSYIIIYFPDDEGCINGNFIDNNEFKIIYAKENIKNKELAYDLFTQESNYPSYGIYKEKILFLEKRIFFKAKVKVMLEYE